MKRNRTFDRDLSWLAFNERVLLEAQDQTVPLYERIKFLAIYSSNLDEFFRVRVALLNQIAGLKKTTVDSKLKIESSKLLLEEILKTVDKQPVSYTHLRAHETV